MSSRIYVASLSDYTKGVLHGEWIDIDQSAEDIHAKIAAMLRGSRDPGAEEWAIHDFELPAGLKLEEYSSIERVAALGQALGAADDEEAFAAWYAVCLNTPDSDETDSEALLSRFQDAYMGSGDTFKDWIVSNDFDALGIDSLAAIIKQADEQNYFGGPKHANSELFEKLTNYIDWDIVARDMESDFTTHRVNGTVYVFLDS